MTVRFMLLTMFLGVCIAFPANAGEDGPSIAPIVMANGKAFIYKRKGLIDDSGFIPVPPEQSGTVLEGDPKFSFSIDLSKFITGLTAGGIVKSTKGKWVAVFPVTEHATLISGRMEITDMNGMTVEMRPGDSYLILEGTEIIQETISDQAYKSYFFVGPPPQP